MDVTHQHQATLSGFFQGLLPWSAAHLLSTVTSFPHMGPWWPLPHGSGVDTSLAVKTVSSVLQGYGLPKSVPGSKVCVQCLPDFMTTAPAPWASEKGVLILVATCLHLRRSSLNQGIATAVRG